MIETLPGNGGYVAAAYLVFLGLVLVYVAIMAVRLGNLERELATLDELVSTDEARPAQERAPA